MLLDLARSLELSVVAEGYIFSRPIIPDRDGPLILPAHLMEGRRLQISA